MSLDISLEDLQRQHQELSREVEIKQQNPATDSLVLTELKKRKLQLKEQISQLARS
ncbi:MAG: YdcH family protein [Rhodobacteraceae bacterium]|nr:YdcH family protein [Paracoccaceae bacterium]